MNIPRLKRKWIVFWAKSWFGPYPYGRGERKARESSRAINRSLSQAKKHVAEANAKLEAILSSRCLSESNQPYLMMRKVVVERKWNKNYNQDKVCICGHRYYRHSDTYDGMEPVGCKYCECFEFIPQD